MCIWASTHTVALRLWLLEISSCSSIMLIRCPLLTYQCRLFSSQTAVVFSVVPQPGTLQRKAGDIPAFQDKQEYTCISRPAARHQGTPKGETIWRMRPSFASLVTRWKTTIQREHCCQWPRLQLLERWKREMGLWFIEHQHEILGSCLRTINGPGLRRLEDKRSL